MILENKLNIIDQAELAQEKRSELVKKEQRKSLKKKGKIGGENV